MADNGPELVTLFLSECGQMTEKLERLLMEADRSDTLEQAGELFRLVHTLKGTCAMMGYQSLTETAHAFENILSALKADPQAQSCERVRAVVDTGLQFTLYFRRALDGVAAGDTPQHDSALDLATANLAAQFQNRQDENGTDGGSTATAPSVDRAGLLCAKVHLRACPMPHVRAGVIVRAVGVLCAVIDTDPHAIGRQTQSDEAILKDGFSILFRPLSPATTDDVLQKIKAQPFVASCELADETKAEIPFEQARTVTVPQPVINKLVLTMDEILTAEGMIEAYVKATDHTGSRLAELLGSLRYAITQANLITSEIGMRDVGGVFMQMQRAVRGMAKEQGKEIKVSTVGADVQVDQSILEILSDSMIHMVRNAVDHGIEGPDERVAHGKPRAGTVEMTAEQKNGFLTVTVSDDGRGIDYQAILERAEEGGKLVKPKTEYTKKDIANLMLFAGVSTNDKVTQYSGRGVGMGAAVRRIRQAGGKISVHDGEKAGTVFTLTIPITLLVIDGVRVNLYDGSEVIVPANAIRHISVSDEAPALLEFRGKMYRRALFPGEGAMSVMEGGCSLLFERDFGAYYIRAKKVRQLSSYYIKPLPEIVADAFGKTQIFSGCALRRDARLCCVLDVAKLIETAETEQEDFQERRKGYEIHS